MSVFPENPYDQIQTLKAQLAEAERQLSEVLNTRHDSKDGLALLYSVANMLPACELFAAVSGGIQDLQYHKQQAEEAERQRDALKNLLEESRIHCLTEDVQLVVRIDQALDALSQISEELG